MLKAQHNARAAALAVAMLIAFSHVAARSERAAAVSPERPYVSAGTAPNSVATFHTFDIEEVFSNFDGSLQFIELRERAGVDGHFHFAGNQLTSDANVFTYPTDLPDPDTAYRSVLIATAGFAALPGAVTPDYIIPEHFFEVTGDTISIFEVQTNSLVDTFVFGGPPQDPCLCDADVDNNGVVDAVDGVCIMTCRGGDCSCCLSSCDVNCDGVVDTGDIGDDIINDPSAWLCLFQAGLPEVCCAATGACCDTTTGGCTNEVVELNCTEVNLVWSDGLSCAEVTCTGPATGACCDLATGVCENEVTEGGCMGVNQVWSVGLSCSAVECPTPPGGACCNLGNGHCEDGVLSVACDGSGLVWTELTLCSAVTCAVPPQDPCTCDGDVDNNGTVNIVDGVCIMECRNGDCSCCLSSCDVNCDGVVDMQDIADDVITTPSTWLCLFQGGLPEVCCVDASGACCDTTTGGCTNGVFELSCTGVDLVWSQGLSCAAASCPIPPDGACCDLARGSCQGDVLEVDCTGVDPAWSQGLSCAEVSCPIPPNGACCDLARGSCQGDVLEVDCTGVDLVWSQGLSCAAVSCPIPPDGACCDVENGQCQDGVPEVDCTGIGLVWTASTACSALSCVATFLPTDGALSLNSDGTTGINSPTNFAGEMGSVNAAPPIPTMSRTSLVVMMLLFVTAGVAITRKRRRGISPST